MRAIVKIGVSIMALALAGGCGGAGASARKAPVSGGAGVPGGAAPGHEQVSVSASSGSPQSPTAPPAKSGDPAWDGAVDAFYAADVQAKGAPWSGDRCEDVANRFVDAAKGTRAAEGHYNAGVAYQRCGKLGDAEREYKKALEINPNHGPSLANLGEMAYRAGRTQEAQQLFEKAVKNDANREVSSARINLAWIGYQQIRATNVAATRQQLEADALRNLQSALAIDNDNVVAYTVMALIYMEGSDKNRNRLEFAQLLLDSGQKRNDHYAPLWNARGILEMRKGNVSKALEDFRKAVALDPGLQDARMNVAQIVLSSRNYQEAETQFRQVLKASPRSYEALIGLGVALRGQATVLRAQGQAAQFAKKIDEAESTYKKAMEIDSNRPAAYYNLGLLYKDYRTNDNDQNKNIAQYRAAKRFFEDYLARADKSDAKRAEARGHIQDCDKYVEILQKAVQAQASGSN